MDVLVPILSESIAFIGVLSIASMVLITTSYVGNNKVFYQTFIFGSLFAASVAYLYLSSPTQLASFWKEYTSLSNTTKVALATFVVFVIIRVRILVVRCTLLLLSSMRLAPISCLHPLHAILTTQQSSILRSSLKISSAIRRYV